MSSITIIASIVFKNQKFGIGYNGDLLFKIPKDMKFFKEITSNNTVVMGYKTWLSIPNAPLINRKNIVLTRHSKVINNNKKDTLFMNFNQFKKYYSNNLSEKIYVIGGSQIYSLFLNDKELKPNNIIFTHITPPDLKNVKIDTFIEPDLISQYRLTGYSEQMMHHILKYRILYYSLKNTPHEEEKYITLIKKILENGNKRIDRTNVGTLSLFGQSLRFDISETIPLLTSKSVSFKNILEELLWFCRGETDATILKSKGVNIWNGNSSREFLDSRNLHHYKEGECGPIYGHQWRKFGKSQVNNGIDQLEYVENLLKTDPMSRRIMLSAWNPVDFDKMALLPCHTHVQWYVENKKDKKVLSCMFNMRSSDFALAGTYNIVSYSILTYILAKKTGMVPGEIIYTAGDCHLYLSHLEAVKEQFNKGFRPFPVLQLNDSIKNKPWENISSKDFSLIGYFPNSGIKMKMAV
jgi:thymidylate synthase